MLAHAMDGPIRLWIIAKSIVLTMRCHVDAPNNNLSVNMQYGMIIRIGHPVGAIWQVVTAFFQWLLIVQISRPGYLEEASNLLFDIIIGPYPKILQFVNSLIGICKFSFLGNQ